MGQSAVVQTQIHQTEQRLYLRFGLDWVVLIIVLTLLAAVLWNVWGIHTSGLYEEWIFYKPFDLGISPFSALNSAIASQPQRFLMPLCYAIGYWLTPDSFVGLNLLAILIVVIKGSSFYLLLRRLLPDKRDFAFAASVLFILYPADTSLFLLRFLSDEVVVIGFILAVYLLVVYWQTRNRWALIGLCAALFLCTGSYEAAYPLIFLTPSLLVVLNKGWSRRVFNVAVLWWSVPAIMFIFDVVTFLGGHASRQVAILNTDTSPLFSRFGPYLSYLKNDYIRTLFGGWIDAVGKIEWGTVSLTIAGLLTLMFGLGLLTIFILEKRDLQSRVVDKQSVAPERRVERRYLYLFLAGLAIIGLGYLMFLPLSSISYDTDRVYLLSSIGGTLCVTTAIFFLGQWLRRTRIITITLLSGLMVAAIAYAVLLCQQYRYDSQLEQRFLAQFAQQTPDLRPGSIILVRNETFNTLANFGVDDDGRVSDAVNYLYKRSDLTVYMCNVGWETVFHNALACSFGVDQVAVGSTSYPPDRVVVFDYTADQGLTLQTEWPVSTPPVSALAASDSQPSLPLYDPARWIISTAAPPIRVHSLFASWPFKMDVPQDEGIHRQSDLTFSADTLPERFFPTGWSGGWSTANDALLHVWLAPDHDYQVQFKCYLLQVDLGQTVALIVNNQAVQLTISTDTAGNFIYQGLIPQSVIAQNVTDTTFDFHIDKLYRPQDLHINADRRLLGLHLNSLSLTPVL